MCLLKNERYKYIFQSPGSCPWGGTKGYRGGGGVGGRGVGGGVKLFLPEIQPDLVCELHEWHTQLHNFLGPRLLGPWGGAKRSNII